MVFGRCVIINMSYPFYTIVLRQIGEPHFNYVSNQSSQMWIHFRRVPKY